MNRKSLLALPYRLLYAYQELYETRFEASVAFVEVLLIAFGLAIPHLHHEAMFEHAEQVILGLLALTVTSRWLVSMRRARLGYAYGRILGADLQSGESPEAVRRFQARIESAPMGYAPGREADWSDRRQRFADAIASQTATLLSSRSWWFMDPRWRMRERDALGEWFREFPSALWVIPEDGDTARSKKSEAVGGYFSVIVPMSHHSRRSIRRGHRATDLAELDPDVLECLRHPRAARPVQHVDLLAYLHIHVPTAGSTAPRDEAMLLSASIQHLALLLHSIYGTSARAEKDWDFSVLCESSNDAMNKILGILGFVRIEREPDGSKTQRREARSYAGFTLFELKVERGGCEQSDGEHLLAMMRRLAPRTVPLVTEPHSATADASAEPTSAVVAS